MSGIDHERRSGTRHQQRLGGVIFALVSLSALVALTTDAGIARGADAPFSSGRDIGQLVPSFYVRAVTGPLRNKSVCYVCRNGSRPTVMILFRDTEQALGSLLKDIDKIVDANRAEGLRSFGVLVSPEPGKAISRLQTMAFNRKINLPLAVATDVVGSPSCQNLNDKASVTVVLYRRQRVVGRYGFRAGALDKKGAREVLAGVRRLLDES
tara:strand:+ start:423 stop:1052 length:630 start_codon:yes stop_codon:yes gene_type:complete